MSRTDIEPLPPQQYTSGLVVRAVAGGALLAIAVLVGVVFADASADPGTLAGWFAADGPGGMTRGIWLLIIAAIIDCVLLTHWTITGSRRVAAWRQANDQG